MIDLLHLEKYSENNRIEAKKSLGGFPQSVWETYSAFANTLGGIILLGVEEYADHSLHAIDLPEPEKLVKEFWDTVNNTNKVSVNILSNKHVTIEEVDGKHIIVITVPRAQRSDRPVYIGGNPLGGAYRRNGEGDYKCTKEEVQAMLRDASVKTQDMLVLGNMGLDVFDYDSIRRYRNRMQNCRPGHVWEELEDEEFLYKLGAVGRDEDGKLHPTAAGLLMFGHEYEIVKEYPNYFLDYRERMDDNTRWTDRIVSSSGDWSGNLYDFYFRVYNKITQDIKVPFKLEGGDRIDDTPVHKALREALANCLINADYYGRQGLVIVKGKYEITFSNPGGFRIDIEAAKTGGVSDPRNGCLIKMFNLVNIGERAGSGIPNIYSVWKKQGWSAPDIFEAFDPERITISLPIEIEGGDNEAKSCDKPDKSCDNEAKSCDNETKSCDKPAKSCDNEAKSCDNEAKSCDKPDKSCDNETKSCDNQDESSDNQDESSDKKQVVKTIAHKAAIIQYLTDHAYATSTEISELLGITPARVRKIFAELIADNIVVAQGANKNRIYKLKR